MVRVASRQLDKVRVEQNHCQGLHTDRASYSGADSISEWLSTNWTVAGRLRTVVNAARLPRP